METNLYYTYADNFSAIPSKYTSFTLSSFSITPCGKLGYIPPQIAPEIAPIVSVSPPSDALMQAAFQAFPSAS